jgi:hypothetical protein
MTRRIPLAVAVVALVAGAACSGDDDGNGDHRAVAASRAVDQITTTTTTKTTEAGVTLTLRGRTVDGLDRRRRPNRRVEIILEGIEPSWCAQEELRG